SKSPEPIRRYSQQNMDFLIQKDVKALVIACNSASTQMQEPEYQGLPLYNVITPGAETALAHSQNHRIGVLGTQATILSAAYEKKIKSLAPDAEVFSVACPLFVPLAEEGWVDDPITNLIVYRYLNLILPKSVDTIILACTHYPIL